MVFTVYPNPNTDNFLALDHLEDQQLHFCEKGEMIKLRVQGGWQIYRGIAQMSQLNNDGDEILLGWMKAGEFIGLDLSFSQLDFYHAIALSDVYLKWYSKKAIQLNPQLSNLVLGQTIKRLRLTESLLAIASYKRVEERLVALLQLLVQDLGQPHDDAIRLQVRLTHQMLANAIGTTRVTVTRILGELQNKGQVSFDSNRHLLIHNLG